MKNRVAYKKTRTLLCLHLKLFIAFDDVINDEILKFGYLKNEKSFYSEKNNFFLILLSTLY